MALSNWDTFAVNESGENLAGELITPENVRVEIYKNWLYLHDPGAWHPNGSFIEDTIAQINEGEMNYRNIFIKATRGPKDGIYVAAVYNKPSFEKNAEGKHEKNEAKSIFKVLIGCGVYGYKGNKYVGIEKTEIEFLKKWVQENFNYDQRILNIDLNYGKRFNQGDAFFLESDKVTTDIGMSKKTILEQLMEE